MKPAIEMAREANAFSYVKDADSTPHLWAFSPTELERLVELVRADERSVEREVCAQIAEAYREWDDTGMGIAAAIRARSNT